MDVEVVTDNMPARDLWGSFHHGLHMGQEIFLGTRRAAKRSQELSRHHVATQDEATSAMTLIFKFPSLYMAWGQRQSGMFAFQGLNPGELVRTHAAFAQLGPFRCIVIHGTNSPDRFISLWIRWRGEPIANQMGLEIPFFNRRDACRGEMDLMIPRCITSSAISRPVQCVMGRSFGCSHAKAINWQHCSAVI